MLPLFGDLLVVFPDWPLAWLLGYRAGEVLKRPEKACAVHLCIVVC